MSLDDCVCGMQSTEVSTFSSTTHFTQSHTHIMHTVNIQKEKHILMHFHIFVKCC